MKFSRLGVGNDLFYNARSIKRILCPAVNAYECYDEILRKTKKASASVGLVLVALGATATVLAYDLAKVGIWAIDIGHVDIEYEWMNSGAIEKIPVKSKYVNEAKNGRCMTKLTDEKYNSEIIARIGI